MFHRANMNQKMLPRTNVASDKWVHTTLDWLGEWFWTTHVWMNIFPFVPFALFSFSHLLQLQVQCYAHFGHHLCSDLGSSWSLCNKTVPKFCAHSCCPLAWSTMSSEGKDKKSQRACRNACNLGMAARVVHRFSWIANVQDLCNWAIPKHIFSKKNDLLGKKQSSSSFCLISFSTGHIEYQPSAYLLVLLQRMVHMLFPQRQHGFC